MRNEHWIFINCFRGICQEVYVTLFLWATHVMNYSNIGHLSVNHNWLCFLLLHNSFLELHFQVYYSTCKFSIPTFQTPHMKMGQAHHHVSRCSLTQPVAATFPGHRLREQTRISCQYCVWPDLGGPWLTRAQVQTIAGGLLALNPCSAFSKNPSLIYLLRSLFSAIWCSYEPWKGDSKVLKQATGRDDCRMRGEESHSPATVSGDLETS